LQKPLIIAYRDPWEGIVQHLAEAMKLPREHVELVQFADDAEGVMKLILEDAAKQQQQ
jgi:hypothetical protein